MSAANDLIERLEKETGQRIDDNDGDNLAMAGLFGATSRLLGQSPPSYRERDDVVAGLLIRHRMTPAYREKEKGNASGTDEFDKGPTVGIKSFFL